MVEPDIRIINRAICLVEDQDVREAARSALHRYVRKTWKLERKVERLGLDKRAAVGRARKAEALARRGQ